MSKLLATTTLAEVNPEPRDRRAASAAKTAAVEQDRAAMLSPAGLEVLVFLARLLGRQEGREPLEALQAGQGQVLDPARVEPPAEFLSVQEAAAYAKVSTQDRAPLGQGG